MSLSKPKAGNKNPCVKFIKWNGGKDKGYFSYYDKTIPSGEKDAAGKEKMGRDIVIKLRNLIILDADLMSITGFNKKKNQTIQSNEVSSFDTGAVLTVNGWIGRERTELLKGTYKDIKPKMEDIPHYNYTKCIYAMLNGELVHLQLKGNAVWQFGQASGGTKETHYLNHIETKSGKNGEIEFVYPTFAFGEKFSEEDLELAIDMDSKVVQPYLEAYLGGKINHDDINQEVAEDTAFDSKQWRKATLNNGKRLGSLAYEEIQKIHEDLQEAGDDGPLSEYVGQAMYDYQQAAKTWKDLKDKDGRQISDYNLEELREAYSKIPEAHPMRIKVEMGIIELEHIQKEEPSGNYGDDDFDDDDIPF